MTDNTIPNSSWVNPPPPWYVLADPEASIKAFIAGTSVVLPEPLVAIDEPRTLRMIAAQLGQSFPAGMEPVPDDLWKFISRVVT